MNKLIKNFLILIIIFLIVSVAFSLFQPSVKEKEIPLSQLVLDINQEKIKQAVVSGNEVSLLYQDGTKALARKEEETPLSQSLVNYGVDTEKLKKLEFETKKEESVWLSLGPLFVYVLPFINMISYYVYCGICYVFISYDAALC